MSNITCSVDGCAKTPHSRSLCMMHYQRLYHSGALEKIDIRKECAGCGDEFSASHPSRKFCADKCRHDYHYRRRVNRSDLTCRVCGGNMIKHSTSAPQGEAAHRKCLASEYPQPTDCPICGDTFKPYRRAGKQWTRTCSKPCGMRLAIREGTHNLQDGKQVGRDMAKVERNWRKRRALKLSAKSEPYTKEEIAARDNYICYLCSDPVDMSLVWPDPEFATVEHVIALTNGGDDTPDNVRLAHLNCNIRKGTKTLEEVRYGRQEAVATREDCEGRGSGTTSVLYGFDPAR